MEAVAAFDLPSIGVVVDLQRVRGMDPLDDERLALQLDLTGDLGPETTVSGGDASCFERTPERPGQSAAGRRDEVVDRGRIRWEVLLHDPVVLGDRTVHTERDRVVASG
jgi:hypothetical protein